jgi:hypothetical protein
MQARQDGPVTMALFRLCLLSSLVFIGACLFAPTATLAHTESAAAAGMVSSSVQESDYDAFGCGGKAPSCPANCGGHQSCGAHANTGCCGPALPIAVPASYPHGPAEFLAEFPTPRAGVTPDLPKKPPRLVS